MIKPIDLFKLDARWKWFSCDAANPDEERWSGPHDTMEKAVQIAFLDGAETVLITRGRITTAEERADPDDDNFEEEYEFCPVELEIKERP